MVVGEERLLIAWEHIIAASAGLQGNDRLL
jgi:hypothetical protein